MKQFTFAAISSIPEYYEDFFTLTCPVRPCPRRLPEENSWAIVSNWWTILGNWAMNFGCFKHSASICRCPRILPACRLTGRKIATPTFCPVRTCLAIHSHTHLWLLYIKYYIWFILSDDFSRVKLEVIDNDPNTDYINASFIKVNILHIHMWYICILIWQFFSIEDWNDFAEK